MIVFRSRPESIKMYQLMIEIEKENNVRTDVCATGQHRKIFNQDLFNYLIKHND